MTGKEAHDGTVYYCYFLISIISGHYRKLSNQGVMSEMKAWDDNIRCTLHTTAKAHQKPINLLLSECGRVVTGSQDHTLKVRNFLKQCQ